MFTGNINESGTLDLFQIRFRLGLDGTNGRKRHPACGPIRPRLSLKSVTQSEVGYQNRHGSAGNATPVHGATSDRLGSNDAFTARFTTPQLVAVSRTVENRHRGVRARGYFETSAAQTIAAQLCCAHTHSFYLSLQGTVRHSYPFVGDCLVMYISICVTWGFARCGSLCY
ncbi:hypothetical protein CBL_00694 [Carabus blaptoides fortunei]